PDAAGRHRRPRLDRAGTVRPGHRRRNVGPPARRRERGRRRDRNHRPRRHRDSRRGQRARSTHRTDCPADRRSIVRSRGRAARSRSRDRSVHRRRHGRRNDGEHRGARNGMKVALVADYLNQAGGAERVLGAIHRIFPEAPIFATIAEPVVIDSFIPGADVRTSWMQWLPGLRRHYRKYFLLYPWAVESFDLTPFDLVVSSSSAYAKSVITRPDACHVCYCHTPMRFAWNFANYAARERWGPLTRRLLPPLIDRVRRWDRETADRPELYLANS